MPSKQVGKYTVGRTLGEGTFGKVKAAVNTETGEHVAIKVIEKEKIQAQELHYQIKKEISIMKVVNHPNVVRMYEVLASRTKIFIVLELVSGGELFDKIVSKKRFDEALARFYFRQLIRGVKYCHSIGVFHRDLKPENLLLDAEENLKISDFGLSALYTGSDTDEGRATLLHTTCGTPNYVAPEVLADKGYDGAPADIWSCGVILYVLLAGYLPFDEPTVSALFRKIQMAEFTYPPWFTPSVRAFLGRILVTDVPSRLTLAALEAEPWFVGEDGYSCSDGSKGGAGEAGAGGQQQQQPGSSSSSSSSGSSSGSSSTPPKPLRITVSELMIAAAVKELEGGEAAASSSSSSSSSRGSGSGVEGAAAPAPTPTPTPTAPPGSAPPPPSAAAPLPPSSSKSRREKRVAGPAGEDALSLSTPPSAPGQARQLTGLHLATLFAGMAIGALVEGSAAAAAAAAAAAVGEAGPPLPPSAAGGAAPPPPPPLPLLLLRASAPALLARLTAALKALGASTKESRSEGLSIKGKLATAHGEVALRATVYAVSPGVSVCEIRRSRGETLEYTALNARLQGMLGDLCMGLPVGGEGGVQ